MNVTASEVLVANDILYMQTFFISYAQQENKPVTVENVAMFKAVSMQILCLQILS